ncbi:protein-L-histidine N-pros-methyltransferase [Arctopsyche grandis]|uniref:protein-L-histidine N-pros-methyltransferase n=1 Tax=Arctopsyche grandis TaxID=121162 RepID=UPI00406DA0F5
MTLIFDNFNDVCLNFDVFTSVNSYCDIDSFSQISSIDVLNSKYSTSVNNTFDSENLFCKKMSTTSLNGGVFRPRGALARTLYDKHQNDCKLREINKMDWYLCNLDAMSDNAKSRFHQLSPDEDTRNFIANSIDKSSWIWTQIWYSLVTNVLSWFMTKTDINGWLGRGSMFVLSLGQLSQLINVAAPRHLRPKMEALVDVGAGDGEVTLRWSPLFQQLYATEMSNSMKKLLLSKGFRILDTENWWNQGDFSVISMLNLLDRCSEPHSMLMTARQALKDDGLLIIALVLPFRPYVEYSSNHSPSERLPISGETFEEQVESFISYARSDVGLETVSWTKVPYLCEGDMNQSYYWLDDAVFIFRKLQ